MKNQKVSVFTKFFWPEGSGGELATYLIVKGILAKRFDVTIVSSTMKPHPTVLRDCRYIVWDVSRSRYKPLDWLKLMFNTRWVKSCVERADIVYIPSHTLLPLAIAIKKIKPCVRVILHLHNYQPLTYTSVFLANNAPSMKSVIIIERYEHDSITRAIATGLLQPLNGINVLALHYADTVICVSRRQAEIISNRAPQLAHKIRVVYNPLPETPPVEEKFENPTFTYTGGGSYVKGFHMFIRASLNVLKLRSNTSFMLMGEFRHQHMNLLKKLNHAHAYALLGHIPHEDVLRLYSKSHAVLVPSICEEPLPYVVMEAMAMGAIPIASRIGGIPEIVKGTYAERMMFTPGNSNEMADRMVEVLSLPKDQLVDIGYKLREVVLRRFNNEMIKRQLLKVFGA